MTRDYESSIASDDAYHQHHHDRKPRISGVEQNYLDAHLHELEKRRSRKSISRAVFVLRIFQTLLAISATLACGSMIKYWFRIIDGIPYNNHFFGDMNRKFFFCGVTAALSATITCILAIEWICSLTKNLPAKGKAIGAVVFDGVFLIMWIAVTALLGIKTMKNYQDEQCIHFDGGSIFNRNALPTLMHNGWEGMAYDCDAGFAFAALGKTKYFFE